MSAQTLFLRELSLPLSALAIEKGIHLPCPLGSTSLVGREIPRVVVVCDSSWRAVGVEALSSKEAQAAV